MVSSEWVFAVAALRGDSMCSRLEMTNCGLVRSRTQKNFDDWFRKLQELERVVLCIILNASFLFS